MAAACFNVQCWLAVSLAWAIALCGQGMEYSPPWWTTFYIPLVSLGNSNETLIPVPPAASSNYTQALLNVSAAMVEAIVSVDADFKESGLSPMDDILLHSLQDVFAESIRIQHASMHEDLRAENQQRSGVTIGMEEEIQRCSAATDAAMAPATLHLYFRTCKSHKPKVGGLSKFAMLRASLMSLRDNLMALPPQVTVHVTVIADGYEESTLQLLADNARRLLASPWMAANVTVVTVVPSDSGNRETNLVQYGMALAAMASDPQGLVYFLEEDYLHTPCAVANLLLALQWLPTAAVTPYAHPDAQARMVRFLDTTEVEVAAVPGGTGHWVQAESTTMTFAMALAAFQQVQGVFMEHAPDDYSIWAELHTVAPQLRLYTAVPSLGTHLDPCCLPPLFPLTEALRVYTLAQESAWTPLGQHDVY